MLRSHYNKETLQQLEHYFFALLLYTESAKFKRVENLTQRRHLFNELNDIKVSLTALGAFLMPKGTKYKEEVKYLIWKEPNGHDKFVTFYTLSAKKVVEKILNASVYTVRKAVEKQIETPDGWRVMPLLEYAESRTLKETDVVMLEKSLVNHLNIKTHDTNK